MAENKRYWKRIGRVELEGCENIPDYLDFKFNVEKTGSIYNNFSVGVLGLNSNDVNAVTVWKPTDAISQARTVRVYAGYDSQKMSNLIPTAGSLIAKGYVWKAFPTPPPEMWVNFECMHFLSKKIPVEKEQILEGTPREIFSKICKLINMMPVWMVETLGNFNKTVRFPVSGSYDELPMRFAQMFNLTVFEDNDWVYCYNKNGQYIYTNTKSTAKKIDIDNGMIDIVKADVAKAYVKTRLNDDYGIMTWVYLQSKLIPKANGYYWVIRKKHTGHFRGDEWFTELEMIRESI